MRYIRKIAAAVLIASMALLFTSCFIQFLPGGNTPGLNDTIRVIGTAERDSVTGEYHFASADIIVDGHDITDEIIPLNPKGLTDDVEHDVVFTAPAPVRYHSEWESHSREYHEFIEWKIMDITDIDTTDMLPFEVDQLRETLDAIDIFMNTPIRISDGSYIMRKYSESISGLSSEYLQYLVPTYTETTRVALVDKAPADHRGNGTSVPFTQEEFCSSVKDRRILSLKIAGNDTDIRQFNEILRHALEMRSLESLKIEVTTQMSTDMRLSDLSGLETAIIRNINFVDNALISGRTCWNFSNCQFRDITLASSGDVTIDGSEIGNITATRETRTIDLRIMNSHIDGHMDFRAPSSGRIDLANVSTAEFLPPATGMNVIVKVSR